MASQTQKNPFLLLSYAVIAGVWVGSQLVDVPYILHLLLLVTSILYAACHLSLWLREEQARARGEKGQGEDDNEEDAGEADYETLKASDAAWFPLIGSASLFSLYMAFKFFDKDTVNLIISVYFCLMGLMALTSTFSPVVDAVGPEFFRVKYSKHVEVKHPLPESIGGASPWKIGIDATVAEMLTFVASGVFCGFYFQTKHWAMNNVLGICFCLQGIERFSLGTYKIGAILLVGLFFYDIFWVFGTEVMVTVAKSLDGPIKILFPRTLVRDADTGKLDMSLLGLGDIVIPGFFLALLLRFDAHRADLPCIPADIHAAFPKPYFHSALLGYVLGLATTLYVMIVFDAAQPALLYLVPACLGSSLLCATLRGELKELFAYSEEEEEEEERKDKGEDEGDEKKDATSKKTD